MFVISWSGLNSQIDVEHKQTQINPKTITQPSAQCESTTELNDVILQRKVHNHWNIVLNDVKRLCQSLEKGGKRPNCARVPSGRNHILYAKTLRKGGCNCPHDIVLLPLPRGEPVW